MWPHNYAPVLNSLGWSTLAAAVPIFVLLLLIGVLRKPAWIAGLSGLAAGLVVAIGVYGMPVARRVLDADGRRVRALPIAWIVYWAVVLIV
jgi:lactate permease